MGAEEEGPGFFRDSRTGEWSGDQAGVVLHVDRKWHSAGTGQGALAPALI